MQRICFISAAAADLRKQEAEFHAREVRWAIWCLAIVGATFIFTLYMVMHIETIMKAKGF